MKKIIHDIFWKGVGIFILLPIFFLLGKNGRNELVSRAYFIGKIDKDEADDLIEL